MNQRSAAAYALVLALLLIWADIVILRSRPPEVTRIRAQTVHYSPRKAPLRPPKPLPAVRHRAIQKVPQKHKPESVPRGAVADRIARAWPGNDSQILRVAMCESGLNPRSVGSAGERGVMQIHPVHIPAIRSMGLSWSDMFFVEANVRVAWALYKAEGWSPWMTCGYRQFGPR